MNFFLLEPVLGSVIITWSKRW